MYTTNRRGGAEDERARRQAITMMLNAAGPRQTVTSVGTSGRIGPAPAGTLNSGSSNTPVGASAGQDTAAADAALLRQLTQMREGSALQRTLQADRLASSERMQGAGNQSALERLMNQLNANRQMQTERLQSSERMQGNQLANLLEQIRTRGQVSRDNELALREDARGAVASLLQRMAGGRR